LEAGSVLGVRMKTRPLVKWTAAALAWRGRWRWRSGEEVDAMVSLRV
jgi:hypothetical protein